MGDRLQFADEAMFLHEIILSTSLTYYDWVRSEQYLTFWDCWLFERCYWSKKEPTCRTLRYQNFRFTTYPLYQWSRFTDYVKIQYLQSVGPSRTLPIFHFVGAHLVYLFSYLFVLWIDIRLSVCLYILWLMGPIDMIWHSSFPFFPRFYIINI